MSELPSWSSLTKLQNSQSLEEAAKQAITQLLTFTHADVVAFVCGDTEESGQKTPSFGCVAYYEETGNERKAKAMKLYRINPHILYACNAETEFMRWETCGEQEVTVAAADDTVHFHDNIGFQLIKRQVESILFKAAKLDDSTSCLLECIYFGKKDSPVVDDDSKVLEKVGTVAGAVVKLLCQVEKVKRCEEKKDRLMEAIRSIPYEFPQKNQLQPIIACLRTNVRAQRVNFFEVVNACKHEITISDLVSGNCYTVDECSSLGHAMMTATTLNIEEASSTWKPLEAVDDDAISALIVPVLDSSGNPVGAVEAVNRTEAFQWNLDTTVLSHDMTDPDTPPGTDIWPFSLQDESIIRFACPHIATLLRNVENFRESRTVSMMSEGILNVLQAASEGEDLKEIFEAISHSAKHITGSEDVCLFIVGRNNQAVFPLLTEHGQKVQSFDESQAIRAAERGESVYEDCEPNPQEKVISKALSIPIRLPSSLRPVTILQVIERRPAWLLNCRNREALENFCLEVGMAMKKLSVDMTFASLFEQGKLNLRQQEVQGMKSLVGGESVQDLSLVQQFTDAAIEKRLRKRFQNQFPSFHSSSTEQSLEAAEGSPHSECVADLTEDMSRDQGYLAAVHPDNDDPIFFWEFNCLTLTAVELKGSIWKMINYWELKERFQVPVGKFTAFIDAVETNYRQNPFHNFYHAVDAMQATFLIIAHTNAINVLTSLDCFATLLAALCHDIDHPGHSQNLEVNRESRLALLYNDNAVLESYHAHKTFEILRKNGTDVLSTLSHGQYRYSRRVILKTILGTDMSKHFSLIDTLVARSSSANSEHHRSQGNSEHRSKSDASNVSPGKGISTEVIQIQSFDRDKDEDRLELAELIVHTADLSGQASPYEEAKDWGDRVITEFKQEKEQHEKEGFTPPAFMANISSRYDEMMIQSSFISNIVLPLWELMNETLGGLHKPVNYLYRNRSLYEDEAASIEQQQLQ